jgi:hypothetical protein
MLRYDKLCHKANETLKMFSIEPDTSDRTSIDATGLMPGCSLPPRTPFLATNMAYTFLSGVSVRHQATREDLSTGASHQQRMAIA